MEKLFSDWKAANMGAMIFPPDGNDWVQFLLERDVHGDLKEPLILWVGMPRPIQAGDDRIRLATAGFDCTAPKSFAVHPDFRKRLEFPQGYVPAVCRCFGRFLE
jgi:hypothetical protein